MENHKPDDTKFEDIIDADIDMTSETIVIKDSRNGSQSDNSEEPHGGFVVLPTKFPMSIFLGGIIHCLFSVIGLTTIYVEQKATIAMQNEKITKLENSVATRIELNYLEKEIEDLKKDISEKANK